MEFLKVLSALNKSKQSKIKIRSSKHKKLTKKKNRKDQEKRKEGLKS